MYFIFSSVSKVRPLCEEVNMCVSVSADVMDGLPLGR